MIHWTPEGTKFGVGLNIRLLRNSINFYWYWYTPSTYTAKKYGVRFIWYKPRISFYKGEDYIPQHWLFENGLYTVTHEELVDSGINRPLLYYPIK